MAKIIDDSKLVINRGRSHGIRKAQRVLVYCIDDDEIKDPDTGESLGFLEVVKGTGAVISVQENLATIQSDQEKTYTREFRNLYSQLPIMGGEVIRESRIIPFDNPQVGDFVKPI
ncbi:hypothetical protein D082_31670 [Synechocystis sp. PCC 6714]|nr:hypothetical protein D082_31670 [Synechocystis sp. PCC 6714]